MRTNGNREGVILHYLARSLDRQAEMEALIQRLWLRLEEEHVLLNSALHDLAAASKPPHKSTEQFINSWYRDRGVRL